MADQKPAAAHSQTLSRGLRALEILAEASEPISIAELAAALGLHRSIAYRILRTLEDHRLVLRDDRGLLLLGPRMAALARGVQRSLQAAALPELTAAARDLGMTAFLVVLDSDECVTLASVEPPPGPATIAQRPGTRHSIMVGAPGLAIQSVLTDDEWAGLGLGRARRPEASEAARRGYATSRDEVVPGLAAVAVPLRLPGHAPAALAVVHVAGRERDPAPVGARLAEAADRIRGELG
ncbi:IclR family transcriptional regulator [Microlunatus parietis]|uniref:DNA-binding IclR family transcriptional regulator n=1 Tax=Microlunatus parietis TaxID=682979 RepID=A0A7Y9ID75_9ACTN|nr:helix-turn-helix domain-containing protein [Microlunatus parietis]NYE74421.1 DNA-binding IclR family transcriptional regulator [Microlunatus parietis]